MEALDIEVLDKAAVCAMLQIAVRTLDLKVQRGEFPPPVRRGRRHFWSREVVLEWHRREFAAQAAWRPKKTLQEAMVKRVQT